MQAAILLSSPGFVKRLFTGRDPFWCSSAGLANNSYSGRPLPYGGCPSPACSPNWPFPAETKEPRMEALVA